MVLLVLFLFWVWRPDISLSNPALLLDGLRVTASFIAIIIALQWPNWTAKYSDASDPVGGFKVQVLYPMVENSIELYAAVQILGFIAEQKYVAAGWGPDIVVPLGISGIVLLAEVARGRMVLPSEHPQLERSS